MRKFRGTLSGRPRPRSIDDVMGIKPKSTPYELRIAGVNTYPPTRYEKAGSTLAARV